VRGKKPGHWSRGKPRRPRCCAALFVGTAFQMFELNYGRLGFGVVPRAWLSPWPRPKSNLRPGSLTTEPCAMIRVSGFSRATTLPVSGPDTFSPPAPIPGHDFPPRLTAGPNDAGPAFSRPHATAEINWRQQRQPQSRRAGAYRDMEAYRAIAVMLVTPIANTTNTQPTVSIYAVRSVLFVWGKYAIEISPSATPRQLNR
jgi:hypothetical protein